MLKVNDIHCYYGSSYILHGISLEVNEGEVVCLLGRNGAGKTTTLKSIMGIVHPRRGGITYQGINITGMKPYQIARLGIGYVPEDRRIFSDLTIMENLEIGQRDVSHGLWNADKMFELFPVLGERRDNKARYLSGGEQQMLTIARALMGNPQFLLLDEPSTGLAPLLVLELAQIVGELKERGMSVLVSEQNSRFAAKVAERVYIIDENIIAFEGSIDDLMKSEQKLRKHLVI